MSEKMMLFQRVREQRDNAKLAAEGNDTRLAASWTRRADRNETKFLRLFGETVAMFAIGYLG